MELQEIQKLVAAGYTKEEIDALDKEQKKQQDETFWQDMSSKQPQEGSEDYQVRDYLWKQKNLELAEKYSKRTYIWALLGIWPATFFGSIVALIYSSKAKNYTLEEIETFFEENKIYNLYLFLWWCALVRLSCLCIF